MCQRTVTVGALAAAHAFPLNGRALTNRKVGGLYLHLGKDAVFNSQVKALERSL